MLAFSAAGNFATGMATVGIFFLTESAYGYSTGENYALALLLGASYALAAWKAGPLVRVLARPGGTSSRGALAAMSVALAGLCALPWFVRERWVPFLFIGLYAPITGVFWPLVESFLSGGRRGEVLRRAIGSFNVVWSGSMALALLAFAPLVPEHPLGVMLGLGGIHVASMAILPFFERDPARHVEEVHRAPEEYGALLAGHRVLLVASYLVMFALTPYLPELLEEMGVAPGWRAALGSLWMPARVGAFYVFGRWQGWHGREWVAWAGAGLLVVSFGGIVLAPGVGVLVLGQVGFGVALAALYTANLYYTMEVGDAGVDAGGSHEGLIGVGYTLGPLCGAGASGMVGLGWVGEGDVDRVVLGLVMGMVVGAGIWAWVGMRRERG